ncbi:hypothetical protein [Thalassotalea agarivorans]|uniref:Colicin-E5 Imm protein n=1 Tax=Thalassotalea agarivorans TaxID=349064 RepID=A0A1H9Y6M6_THASX|nr:hypothetical protein [Thalassotalea agarivorans]SES64376.1 Colicin-E5 Imm protein [Thalassotalea agarivorans]
MLDRNFLYSDATEFFTNQGNNIMKLTPAAAIEVCRRSTDLNYIVSRVEGGIWHNPGFEMRLDCIWDRGIVCNGKQLSACEEAIRFIENESEEHSAFIISLQQIKT